MEIFRPFCLIVALLLLPTPATAKEQLESPALPDFVVGYEAADGFQSIREEVPSGETVENWSVMITTQRFSLDGTALERFVAGFLNSLRQSCPRAVVSDLQRPEGHGGAAVLFSADCPASPVTGGRETMTVLAISGADALHVKQVAFRPTYQDDRGWVELFLQRTHLDADGS